ncbi:Atxe2 family lasso peptide isopeptidase [Altererythrobacter sp. B11]|uniref:Atxe2 family lasso peptide isopeptidase n=1 Tax=Altererythrobacter sp. B11 TaxID=2060312 RepID=UPI001E57D50D|nr:Atxe2 family lasso peptide isopeptidase [Altererythrobacter sp. B11]
MVFAVPVLAEPISPKRLLEVTDFDGVAISPDGRWVAFRTQQASVERNTYDTAWYVQPTDGLSPPLKVADGGLPLRDSGGLPQPARALWSADGQSIFYLAFLNGKLDVWRAATDGSGARPLTHEPADVRDFSLSDDGSLLIYTVGASRAAVAAAEQDEYDQGIRIDETIPIGQALFRSGMISGRRATQRFLKNGKGSVDRYPLLVGIPDQWRAVDLASGEVRDLTSSEAARLTAPASTAPEDLPSPWKVALDPKHARVALLTRTGDDTGLVTKPDVTLSVLSARGAGRPTQCSAELCSGKPITEVQWRPGSDDVLFTITDPDEGLAQAIYRWNVLTGAVELVTRENGQLNGRDFRNTPTCDASHDLLVCIVSRADRPPQIETIDIATGLRTVLFEPNALLARDMRERSPARLLRWTAANGEEFTGQFFEAREAATAPSPLFITYYRCTGFLRGGLGNEWPLASLAEAGISTLCINDPPRQPMDAVARYNRPLAGVRSAINLLAGKGLVDRKKVGMGGLSFGTEITLWTAFNSDLLAAASVSTVSMTPNGYLFLSLQGDIAVQRLRTVWGLGTPEETPSRWERLSITRHLDEVTAPILMQIPEQEYMFALEYAIPLIRRQQADLYVFPDEPHQKFQPRHKLAVYQRNLDWFRFWLQGYEDAESSKAEQYELWRQLRVASPNGQ